MNQKTVLLAVLGVSLLLVAQNLTPLPLVFLGGKLPSLPLGIWLFIAFTLGLISSRLITIILQSSNSIRDRDEESRDPIEKPEPDSTRRDTFTSTRFSERSPGQSSPPQSFFSKSQPPADSEDDWEKAPNPPQEWEQERPNRVTWGNGEQEDQNTYRSSPQPPERAKDKPKDKDQSQDKVYDADYRVIIPPYGTSSPPPPTPPTPSPSAEKESKETMDWDAPDSNPSDDEDWV